jgi:hypothetical protein
MQISSRSFCDGGAIPGEFSFAEIDPASHFSLSSNRNPHLARSDGPDDTNAYGDMAGEGSHAAEKS